MPLILFYLQNHYIKVPTFTDIFDIFNKAKMLYLVGLGLGDIKDITVKGLEIVKKCDKVYLEHYTSILTVGQGELEKFYEREIILADR